VTPDEVSACLVTRGDVDLSEILDSLPYTDVVVWNNSQREDLKTYGRYAAIAEAKHDVIYLQDDDIVFLHHAELLAAYEPNTVVANMSDGWVEKRNMTDSLFVGAGALVDRHVPALAFARYDRLFPRDDIFHYYPEAILTIPSKRKRVDLPVEVLPWGYAPNRMNAQPWFEDGRAESIRRGRKVRDET
jgi:hypothetical protein